MIVQDETSNGSRSMHSGSQLAFVPSSQAHKQQYYKQQWKRKGHSEPVVESAKSRPAFRQNSVNKIKVIVLLDAATLNDSPLGTAIRAEFQQHEESPTDEKFQLRGLSSNNNNNSSASVDPTATTTTATTPSITTTTTNSTNSTTTAAPTTATNHTIRWTRCNLSCFDDTTLTVQNIPDFEPFVLLVADCEVFLEHMLCSEDGVEFAQLGVYVQGLFVQTRGGVGGGSGGSSDSGGYSMIVALVDLDKAALKVQRKISKEGQVNRDVPSLVDSAVSYLLYECDIEIFRCKRDSELAEYVYTLTRLVSNRIAEAVVTEIDCVAKAQKEKTPEGLEGTEREQFELQQTWSAMLQMLPLMSKDKAQMLISQPSYSCPQHLLNHIHHNTDPEISTLSTEHKKLLLQSAFGARKGAKSGVVQKQAKLSKHVYNLVTSVEPEELISKV